MPLCCGKKEKVKKRTSTIIDIDEDELDTETIDTAPIEEVEYEDEEDEEDEEFEEFEEFEEDEEDEEDVAIDIDPRVNKLVRLKKIYSHKLVKSKSSIKVKLIFILHSIGDVTKYSKSAKVNFQLAILYRKKDFLKRNFVPVLDGIRCFPFIIQNACGDYNVLYKHTGEFVGNILIDDLYYEHPESSEPVSDKFTIMYEVYNIMCEVRVINRLNLVPYNVVYVPISIATNGYPNTEKVVFLKSSQTSFQTVMKGMDATFFSIPAWEKFSKSQFVRMMKVENYNSSISKVRNNIETYQWPRAYYMVKYSFDSIEDTIKYFIIPTMFNNMIIMFSSLDTNDFLALFTTFCLTDIALLFTMPETKCLTISEASITSDLIMSIILAFNRWYTEETLSYKWHWFPSVVKGLLMIGGKLWASFKIKNEMTYLKSWL